MKNLNLFFIWLSLVFFLSPLYIFSQDAQANRQSLLLIPGILNDLDSSTNNLEANITASNKIINDLSLKMNSMQAIIETQQRQLRQASENSANWERIAQERSQEYEQTLQSLEASLSALSLDNLEKDGQILKLTQDNAKQMKVIFIMGGILGIIAAYLIIRLILWIKGGAAASLIKKLL